VDIDLNYIGAVELEKMQCERPKIEKALRAVLARQQLTVIRTSEEHAGGKWLLRYESASGGQGNLELDINFMFRLPLWSVDISDSFQVGTWKARAIPVLDLQELAAGKLAALFARRQARDLFDCHLILGMDKLDHQQVRIAFVVYGAMNRKDWRQISVNDVKFDSKDLNRQLIPTLRDDFASRLADPASYGRLLVKECQEALSIILPFKDSELQFLDLLLEKGIVESSLLTDSEHLQQNIQKQPLLQWKAFNIRRYKGLM